jgi:hypothetical protein
VLTEGDAFLEREVRVLGQSLLFHHALNDFLFELGELADFFLERVLDIFLAQEVETVDAEHLARRPVGVVFFDRFLERGPEHFARNQKFVEANFLAMKTWLIGMLWHGLSSAWF